MRIGQNQFVLTCSFLCKLTTNSLSLERIYAKPHFETEPGLNRADNLLPNLKGFLSGYNVPLCNDLEDMMS